MESEKDPASSPPPSGEANQDADRRGPPVIEVETLVAGGREAILMHDGQPYRLRITANDKLILTK